MYKLTLNQLFIYIILIVLSFSASSAPTTPRFTNIQNGDNFPINTPFRIEWSKPSGASAYVLYAVDLNEFFRTGVWRNEIAWGGTKNFTNISYPIAGKTFLYTVKACDSSYACSSPSREAAIGTHSYPTLALASNIASGVVGDTATISFNASGALSSAVFKITVDNVYVTSTTSRNYNLVLKEGNNIFTVQACNGSLCSGSESIQIRGVAIQTATPEISYYYDALGRLTFVKDSRNDNQDYDYDEAGNRLNIVKGTYADSDSEP